MNGIVVLPSLNRPHLLKEFFNAYKETESEIQVLVLVDKKDAKLPEYKSLDWPSRCELVLTDGVRMGEKIKEVWDRILRYEFVTILNDDHRPKTKKWDSIVASQITGTNVIGTNDGWQAPQRLAGAISYSRKVLETIGWMFPPGVNHLYHDDIWGLLITQAGCGTVLMDVLIEHDHAFKHGIKDETHQKVYAKESWDEDGIAYKKWLDTEAQKDVQKLISIQPKTGLMIATPFHDHQCAVGYMLGLIDTTMALSENRINNQFARVEGSSLLPHARNSLVDMFLNSRCQKMLFVDSDQCWDRMASITLFQSSRRLIAGITPHKRYPINLNFEPLPEDMHFFKDPVNKSLEEVANFAKAKASELGEIEVARAGTGFMMIDRSVFELMADKVAEYYPFDNPGSTVKHREYFKMGGWSGKFRGEDWYFTELAKELKIPIYINVNVVIPHQGIHQYRAA